MSGPSELPPLPRIDGEAILGVFTHTSIRPAGPEMVGTDSFGGNHRLNELGTKVLEMAATAALFVKRPMLTAGDLAVSHPY
jgi:dsRNA-specific ribonuclease